MFIDHKIFEPVENLRGMLSFYAQKPVIIIDDSYDDRIMLSSFLRSFIPADQPVVSLKDGTELLKYVGELDQDDIKSTTFEREIPAMIFLDLMMPRMNGIETVKSMRRHNSWANVPVTLVTCSHDDDSIRRAEEAGANAFLPKPFTKIDVMKAMQRANNFSPSIW